MRIPNPSALTVCDIKTLVLLVVELLRSIFQDWRKDLQVGIGKGGPCLHRESLKEVNFVQLLYFLDNVDEFLLPSFTWSQSP